MKTWLIVLLLSAGALPVAAAPDGPSASLPETVFRFGRVLCGTVVEHEFRVKNEGSARLRIVRVEVPAPLVVASMPASVAPGTEAPIRLKMDTSGLRGIFVGDVRVVMDDPAFPEADLRFEGEIIPLVEVSPAPAFFLAGRRGEARQQSVEIINHEAEPLRILSVDHSSERFTTRIEEVVNGERYRLTLLLKPNGPGGRHSEPIVLRTSSRNYSNVTVVANTYLRERVYTFPDALDFGTLRLTDIEANPALLETLAQTLMVYQFGGTDFRASIRSNPPQLNATSERGPHHDRYQHTFTLVHERLNPGGIRGSVVIETNDPEFPELSVPVTGTIIP